MFQSLFARDFSLRGCTYLLALYLTRKMLRRADQACKTMFLSSYLERGMDGRSLVGLEHAEIDGYCL